MYSDCILAPTILRRYRKLARTIAKQDEGYMGKDEAPWSIIDKRLAGEPVELGGRTVVPVGRLRGKYYSGGNEYGSATGFAGTVEPVEIEVTAENERYTIPIDAALRVPLRRYIAAGTAVAAGCIMICLVTPRIARKLIHA